MAIMEIEWKRPPEVVILRPGADYSCPIDALRGVREQYRSADTLGIDIRYVMQVLDDIDMYLYIPSANHYIWPLRSLVDAYSTEIASHTYRGRKHTMYRVPDDFTDVLRRVVSIYNISIYNGAREAAAVRRKLKEAMKLSWEQFKDRILAMEVAEALRC
jgi:hypothetical protein